MECGGDSAPESDKLAWKVARGAGGHDFLQLSKVAHVPEWRKFYYRHVASI